jgi:hypothetical protein
MSTAKLGLPGYDAVKLTSAEKSEHFDTALETGRRRQIANWVSGELSRS